MKLGRALCAPATLGVALACGPADATPDVPVRVAALGGEPALLVEPSAGLEVAIDGATYDEFGDLVGYHASVVAGPDTTRVEVVDVGGDEESRVRMVMSGDTLEAAGSTASNAIAIVPRNPGGLQIQGADSLTTDVVYDELGRGTVSSQHFVRGGAGWRAVFTDYTHDESNRIIGYHMRLEPAP